MVEVRIYVDPKANDAVAEGVLEGINAYLKKEGLKPDYKPFKWEEKDALERQLLNQRGQIDADQYFQILSKEKTDIGNGKINDKPHWDVIITSRDLKPKERNFVLGSFQGIANKDGSTREDLASMVISTSRLKSNNELLNFTRGYIIGYHEASHHKKDDHCDTRGCMHYHALNGLDDLDYAANIIIKHGKIPLCEIHIRDRGE